MAHVLDRLRRLPPPRLPEDRRGRPARPEPAASCCGWRRRPARRGTAPSGRKAKSVIMVWLAGGPATIDMWDLKPDAPEGIRGEFKPIDTKADGVQISEHLPQDGRGDGQVHHRPLAGTTPSRRTARPRSS